MGYRGAGGSRGQNGLKKAVKASSWQPGTGSMEVGSERFGLDFLSIGLHLAIDHDISILPHPHHGLQGTACTPPQTFSRPAVQLCRLGLQLRFQSNVGALITNSLLCLLCMGDRASGYLLRPKTGYRADTWELPDTDWLGKLIEPRLPPLPLPIG